MMLSTAIMTMRDPWVAVKIHTGDVPGAEAGVEPEQLGKRSRGVTRTQKTMIPMMGMLSIERGRRLIPSLCP